VLVGAGYDSRAFRQKALRRLPDLGFDRQLRSLFLLEGFLWYMPPDVASAILRALVAISANGSQVIFDYILPAVVDGSCIESESGGKG
jgi:O-methyltransferase involved in polyketide biosynthesis